VESEDCRAVVKRRRANDNMLSASYDSASQPEKEEMRFFHVYKARENERLNKPKNQLRIGSFE